MHDLRDSLAARPGSLLLLAGRGADQLAIDLAGAWATKVVSVGQLAAGMLDHRRTVDVSRLVSNGSVFTDLDVLFWEPALHLEVLTLLRQTAKRRPVAFVWPGSITRAIARYSEPGRRDFYESNLRDAFVIRPKPDAYPGETPYTMETVEA